MSTGKTKQRKIGVRFTELKFGLECSQVELGVLERGGIMPMGAQPANEFNSRLGAALERLIHQRVTSAR